MKPSWKIILKQGGFGYRKNEVTLKAEVREVQRSENTLMRLQMNNKLQSCSGWSCARNAVGEAALGGNHSEMLQTAFYRRQMDGGQLH